MAFQAQQIVQLACATAKVPGWVTQAGILLNMILNELCTDYDLSVNRFTFNFAFNSGAGQDSGPYTLPTNWLRAEKENVFYTIDGVKYIMIPETLAQFNSQVQQPGLNAYPQNYAVDNSPIQSGGAPLMYVWPPAGGSYPVTCIYYGQQPDIATPETSTVVPWFPLQLYMLRRLSAEMMQLSNDDRYEKTLAESVRILDKYLKNEGDTQAVKIVSLDRRQFSPYNWEDLKNTKTIGW